MSNYSKNQLCKPESRSRKIALHHGLDVKPSHTGITLVWAWPLAQRHLFFQASKWTVVQVPLCPVSLLRFNSLTCQRMVFMCFLRSAAYENALPHWLHYSLHCSVPSCVSPAIRFGKASALQFTHLSHIWLAKPENWAEADRAIMESGGVRSRLRPAHPKSRGNNFRSWAVRLI